MTLVLSNDLWNKSKSITATRLYRSAHPYCKVPHQRCSKRLRWDSPEQFASMTKKKYLQERKSEKARTWSSEVTTYFTLRPALTSRVPLAKGGVETPHAAQLPKEEKETEEAPGLECPKTSYHEHQHHVDVDEFSPCTDPHCPFRNGTTVCNICKF